MFRGFQNDPFFQTGTNLDDMMGFGSFGFGREPFDRNRAVENRSRNNRGERSRGNDEMMPFGFGRSGFGSLFGNMNNMMREMQQQMDVGFRQNGNHDGGFSFSTSQVYSYTNDGSGQPHVYQASQQETRGPGGIRESKKALKDTRAKLDRMAHARYIGERGHKIEKERNNDTGQVDEKQDYYGINEHDAHEFHNEFASRVSSHFGQSNRHGRQITADHPAPKAIEDAGGRRQRRSKKRSEPDPEYFVEEA